jgi:hypothetical protein
LEILKSSANNLLYLESFRNLPFDVRLCIAWSHGDRLFRILVNAGVDLTWISEHFGSANHRMPAEIAFAENAYIEDVAYPRRITSLGFALASAGYASKDGIVLDDASKNIIGQYFENDPARVINIVADLTLASDSLGSIMCHGGRPAWLSVLPNEMQNTFSPQQVRARVTHAIEGILSGQCDPTEWATLHAIVQDFSVPEELSIGFREALIKLDIVALTQQDSSIALLAAIFAAQNAARLGEDVVAHIRAQLISLASALATNTPQKPEEMSRMADLLLSTSFYLYGSFQGDEDQNRIAKFAQLLDELTQRWKPIVEKCQLLVDKLIDALPNVSSRMLWQLQIKLRALC